MSGLDDLTTESQHDAKLPVICRASFKGEINKQAFYVLLDYIDDMKTRGWEFETHNRKDLKSGNVDIDYVLVRHGL